MNYDEYLREQTKMLKWKYGVSYSIIAEELEMSYNGFLNFVNGYTNLGEKRKKELKRYIEFMTS